jgi:Uma2 family endonuclease
VLHGVVLARLSDDKFFELCQANPSLSFERNAKQEIIIIPPTGSESSGSSGESYGQVWLWNRRTKMADYVYRPGQPADTI